MNKVGGISTSIKKMFGIFITGAIFFFGGTVSSLAARPTIDRLDLSGNCETVQQKATKYVEQINQNARSRDPSICESGKDARLIGQIMVKVAESCQEIPTWREEREAGRKMINEANQTVTSSCI